MLDSSIMSKRSYKQNCALAHAVDLIGERWSLLLVRDLLISPRRFNDLQNSLKQIGSNLLASRLKKLEFAGIVERQGLGTAGHVYALTESGKALEPALLALVRWGLVYGPENQKGFLHRDDWDLLALKALFRANRARHLSVCVQFRSGDFAGWAAIMDQRLDIGLGVVDSADVIVDGTVKDLLAGTKQPEQLCMPQSREQLERFMSAFVLPAQ
jgi:DNA-binding HxlR family transcriptional regulator